MVLNILIILKAFLYTNITNINHDNILIILITSLITISWLSFVNILKIKDKTKDIIKLIIYIIFSLIVFADTIYFLQFNMLPSVQLLSQAGQLSDVSDAIVSILNFKNLLLVLDLPLVIIYSLKKKEDKYKLLPRYSLIPLALIIAFSIFTDKIQSVKAQELYFYHMTDILNSFKDESIEQITDKDIDELRDRAKLKQGKYTGLGEGKNLIVVQVEALQNFVIGMDYKGEEVTPNLNRLIKEKGSIYYDRYYQLVGRGNTSDAEFVSNNSLHPAMDQPSYTRYEQNTFYGLPKLLQDNNYKTFAMHGYKPEFWNREKAYVNQGYEEYLSESFYSGREQVGMGVSDREFFKANVEHLKNFKEKEKRPFYSFMVTLTSHTPFKMDEKYNVLDLDEEYKNTMTGDYLQSIHYTDEQIGFLIEELKVAGLYDDTIIAIYGDHFAIKASDQNENPLMSKLINHNYDYDDMMNIPLIIHMPNEEINEINSNVGSQIDFYPTIQNIMGYDNTKGLVFGRDLNNYEGENTVKPQTYMKKGSFIKDDVTFEIARDGIFDHSRAYNIKSRKQVNINLYRDYYEKAIREINIGDFISANNLLKEYIETGTINLESKESVVKNYTKWESLEDMDKHKGETMLLDINMDEDFERILEKSRENDIDLILSGDLDKAIDLYDKYELDESIIRITDIEDYIVATNNKFKRVLFNPYEKKYSKKDIKSFISTYPNIELELKEKDMKKYKNDNINIYKFVK